jgi:transcriptional regulator with XRE-family HTH domain
MLTPEQCRAARGWLNWSQDDLAKRANVALSTVRSFENDDGMREPVAAIVDAMQQALERAGMTFSSQALGPAGVQYEGRIKERDTYLPVLKILDEQQGGFMKTADLIRALEEWFAPKGEDAEILSGRSDTKFSQIVRNIVSHRTTAANLIGSGYAEYHKGKRGLSITTAGRLYLGQNEGSLKSALYTPA